MERGCEAISLSGNYKGDDDKFDTLIYTANLKSGARAMLVNVSKEIPIRVFRKQKGKRIFHRYDGVYKISSHFGKGPITFLLRRNPVGVGFDKNRVDPAELRKLPLYGLEEVKKSRRLKNAVSSDSKNTANATKVHVTP